jgi:maltooligosyltrehalose trehalohydrolase
MLWMGEEWAASTRWPFFTSHPEPSPARGPFEQRLAEFSRHGWNLAEMIDPQDPRAYQDAVLDWAEADAPGHGEVHRLYRRLIALRAAEPHLRDPRLDRVRVDYDEDAGWLIVHRGSLRVVANLAAEPQSVPVRAADVLLATGDAAITQDALRLDGESAAIVRTR